jgi:NADPH:quinone reductase-like Zn-dependent oxidoreductase
LIQSASGGLGIAAVQIAQAAGAEVYVTVGSDSRLEYMHTTYKIPRERIFSSRGVEYVDEVMMATSGKGVDIFIGTAAGEALKEGFRCLGHFGRFIELGRSDIMSHGELDLHNLKKNITLSSFDLSLLFKEGQDHLVTLSGYDDTQPT